MRKQKTGQDLRKTLVWAVFLFYLGFLVGILFARPRGGDPLGSMKDYISTATNFVPFRTISNYIRAAMNGNILVRYALANILGNLVLFLPVPFFLRLLSGRILRLRYLVPFSLLMLILIETLQLATKRGACDVDDVILNFGGILLGHVLCCYSLRLRRAA